MRFSTAAVVAGAGVASVNAAALQGFNYGATLTSGAVKQQSDFEADFKVLIPRLIDQFLSKNH